MLQTGHFSYLIDIGYEWPHFLENCVTNEKWACKLFAHNAQCSLDNISSYDDDIVSSCNLRSFVIGMFLNDIITDDIIMLIFT